MHKKNHIVLDIDSTVLSPKKRVLALLRHWLDSTILLSTSEKYGLLNHAMRLQKYRGFQDIFRSATFLHSSTIFYEATLRAALSFWDSNYWKVEYLEFDEPIEGAEDFIRSANHLYNIYFVSGRVKELAFDETARTLGLHFGAAPEVILLKNLSEDHHEFKLRTILGLQQGCQVFAMFDDDLSLLVKASTLFPSCKLYWMSSNSTDVFGCNDAITPANNFNVSYLK